MGSVKTPLLCSLAMVATFSAVVAVRSGASIVAGSSPTVFPVSVGAPLPTPISDLRYTPETSIAQGTLQGAVLPGWSPSVGVAGEVTRPGDLAVVDATSSSRPLRLNLFITNLAALAQNYSSFMLRVEVFSSTCDTSCSWSPVALGGGALYVTSATGSVSVNLPPGAYYDVTLAAGGSYLCLSTAINASSALAPTFYCTTSTR